MLTNMSRIKILLILATMPDEAFGWFVIWASGINTNYPDGLGGFSSESRKSITELRKVAKKLLENVN